MKTWRVVTGIVLVLVLVGAFGVAVVFAQPTPAVTPRVVADQPDDTFDLTLLHTNDFHARVDGQSNIGSSAQLATVINQYRANQNNVLLVDAGDQFQGTLFYRLFKAEVVATMMNALGYQAMTFGNHEFDDGPDELGNLLDQINFPAVNANIDASAEPTLAGKFAPSTVVTVNGEQIGIIGAITLETPNISSPGPNVTFSNPVTAVQQQVDQLTAQGVDKIVVLTHLGYQEDMALGQTIHGADVIVGGHSHTFLYSPPTAPVNGDVPAGPYPTAVTGMDGNPVLVVTAYNWGRYLGHLDVTFDDAGVVTAYSGNPIFMGTDVPRDPVVDALLDPYRPAVNVLRNTFVGTTTVELPLTVGGNLICRAGECLLGNMATDAMLYRVNQINPDDQYDIAITNGGGLRAPIDEGPISVGEILEVLPFGNTMATFGLRGSDLLVALENGVSRYGGTSGTGRFPQISGMRFTYNPALPINSRVLSAEVWNGTDFEPVDPDRIYKIVSNDFMRRGGDGYTIFQTNAINPYDFGPPLEEAVIDYVTEFSPITPAFGNRVNRLSVNDTIAVNPTSAMVGETVGVAVESANTGIDVENVLHIVPLDPNLLEYVAGSATNGAFPVGLSIPEAVALVAREGIDALRAHGVGPEGVVGVAWQGDQPNGQTIGFGFDAVVQPAAAGGNVSLAVRSFTMNMPIGSATTALSVPALNTYEVTLQDGVAGYSGTTDTTINAWAPDANTGSAVDIYVRQPGVKSILVQFDLTAITDLAQVDEAEIGFWIPYVGANPVTMEVYELLKSWSESSSTWVQADGSTAWEMPGAMGSSDRAAAATDAQTVDVAGTWVWFDVSDLAQQWIGDPGTNHGVAIVGGGRVNAEQQTISSDYPVIPVRPQLRLVYQAP